LLLINSPARAQQTTTRSEPASLPSTKTLPENYPVITIRGPCPRNAKAVHGAATKTCTTTVTRQEFERLVHAINPKMPKQDRRQLAQNYARMLALSREAMRKRLDKDPAVQALLRYTRTNALASATFKNVIRENSSSSADSVAKFYEDNKSSFDRYTLQRIFIPKHEQGSVDNQTLESTLSDGGNAPNEDMKAVADEIHHEAIAGGDFVALQQKAFHASGIKSQPKIEMSELGRGDLPEGHDQVFDLPIGQVSPVLTDASGYYIYKVISRRSPSLASIRDEVNLHMQNSNTRRALQEIEGLSKAEVNNRYFDKYDAPPPDAREPDMDDD
jgi:hypothetical protein